MMLDFTLPLFAEADQVEPLLNLTDVVIVDLCRPELHARFHLPGAVSLPYQALIHGQRPAPGVLPEVNRLNELFTYLGIHPHSIVIAYDDEGGGAAARLVWTLHVCGFYRAAVINGGIHAWANEGHSLSQDAVSPPGNGQFSVSSATGTALATQQDVESALEDDGVQLLDSRTIHEFTGVKAFAARGGHIPGAIHMDWNECKDESRNLRLKPDEILHAMLNQRGFRQDCEIITYCQTHHRSSHSYLMLKHLGFDKVRGYAGAWAEWGNNPSLPIEP